MLKKTFILIFALVLGAIAQGEVLFEQNYNSTNGTEVGGAQWAVANNVAVRTGADSAGTRALYPMSSTDVSAGYKLSFDWKSDAAAATRGTNNTSRFSLVFDFDKRMTIWTRAGIDLYDNSYLYQGSALESGTWYHFELIYRPDGDPVAPYGSYRLVGTDRTTSALLLDSGVQESGLITPALSADLDYVEFNAMTGDLVSYDNIKLETLPGFVPFPEIVAESSEWVIPVGDVNKDGVLNGADLALARAYLDGDGGESAITRQTILINYYGYSAAEALDALNLTGFDMNGDDFFDAADVAIIEEFVAGAGGSIFYFEDFNQADGVFVADPEIRAGDIAVQESFLASQQVFGNALSSAVGAGRGGLRFGPHLFEVDWSSSKESEAILNAGGFTVQFDWEEKNDGADNWVGFSVGQINCEGYEIDDANTDYSILFRDNGQFLAFDNGVTNKDSVITHASTSHAVQLTYVFESWMPGAEVTVFAELDRADLFKDSFTWDGGRDRCLGLHFNHSGAGIDNFQISTVREKPAFYDSWASGTSLSLGVNDGLWDDAENGGLGDGVNNLYEYALGGDPLADDAADILPGFQTLENHFYYVHNERTDDSSLLYTVQLSTNLISNVWKTSDVELVGESPVSNGWKAVTQRTEMDGCGFMRMKLGGYFQTAAVPFSFDDPAGPQIEFTEAQKLAQYTAGQQVVPMVLAAFNSGADSVTLPPGDYRFGLETYGPNGVIYPLEFSDLVRADGDPFTIDATGATFWFDLFDDQPPSSHFTVGFKNCANIILKGCIIDGSKRGNIEGQITQIDTANNRFEIQPVPGMTVPSSYIGGDNQRLIPFKADGRFCAPLYYFQGYQRLRYDSIEPSSGGRYWVNMTTSHLIDALQDPTWSETYGELGTLNVGDGLSCVYTSTRALSLVSCRKMTLEGIHIYLTKGGVDVYGGYGDHLWKDCYLGPRPGTSQWQGGEGFYASALRHGSTYDNVTIRNVTDDCIDLHGYWGNVGSIAANVMTMAPSPQFASVLADVVAGDRILFYNPTTKVLLGEAAVAAIDGNTVTADRDLSGFAGAITSWPDHECAGWVIQNCHWYDIYQRLLIASGPGIIRNSRFERFGHSIYLYAGEFGVEGGVPHNVTITNNVFIDIGPNPSPAPTAGNWEGYAGIYAKTEADGVMTNLVINDNRFVRTFLNLEGVDGAAISGNRIDDPLNYIAVGGQEPHQEQALFLRDCSSVEVNANLLNDPELYTTPDATTGSPLLGIDVDCSAITLDGAPVGP